VRPPFVTNCGGEEKYLFLFFVLLSFPFYFGSKKHVQQMMDFFSFLV